MATPKSELQNIEKAMVRLRNKLKRADLDYTVQISISSTDATIVRYAAQMPPPAEGLAPVTFIGDSADSLITQIKTATKGIDYDAVEKAYHEAQIKACERTILGHEERIKEIDNPEPEEGNVAEEPTKETTKEEGKKDVSKS